MSQKEVINTLLEQARIEPGFIELVWKKLEEENQEFFKDYHLRLMMNDKILLFNRLLEQHAELTRQLYPPGLGSMLLIVLKMCPFPVTVTTVQFDVGTVLVMLMWTTNLYKRLKIIGAQLAAIFPLAAVHTLGNLFTNTSLGKVVVSFTHNIKASEPFYSAILSALFM